MRHSTKEVWIRLEGVLTPSDAEALGNRIQASLARCKSKLVLDFKKLRWDKVENLEPLQWENYRLNGGTQARAE